MVDRCRSRQRPTSGSTNRLGLQPLSGRPNCRYLWCWSPRHWNRKNVLYIRRDDREREKWRERNQFHPSMSSYPSVFWDMLSTSRSDTVDSWKKFQIFLVAWLIGYRSCSRESDTRGLFKSRDLRVMLTKAGFNRKPVSSFMVVDLRSIVSSIFNFAEKMEYVFLAGNCLFFHRVRCKTHPSQIFIGQRWRRNGIVRIDDRHDVEANQFGNSAGQM